MLVESVLGFLARKGRAFLCDWTGRSPGWGQDEDRRRSTKARFDHHLVKPVAPGVPEKILAALPAR